MGGFLPALRLLLAIAFALAGIGKLADRAGTRAAAEGFGAPRRLAGALASLLPMLELAAAALLVPRASAVAGGGLALALLGAFTAAIARSVARGETPDCHCFGAIHSAPAGPRTLARNVVLIGAAGAVLAAGPGPDATAGEIVAAVAVLALVATGELIFHLLRRNGELLLRIDELEAALGQAGVPLPGRAGVPLSGAGVPLSGGDPIAPAGLPLGAQAPDLELRDLEGEAVTLSSLRSEGRRLLLTFVDPGCGPCTALLPSIAAWQREHADRLRTVVVSRGEAQANARHAAEHGVSDVFLQDGREADEAFQVSGTPSAVLVAGDGTIASGVHSGSDQIEQLVASATGPALQVQHHAPEPGYATEIGAQPPDPVLRTLGGAEVTLSSKLAGEQAVVVFWNPACGFCERMLEELKALDSSPPPGAPALLVISTGDPATNRAMGLRAPVLLDDGFRAGVAFGSPGTPSAVLIDAGGRIASPMVAGAEAVLELAGAPRRLAVAA